MSEQAKAGRFALVAGFVWCDFHGTVHDRDPNPYDMPKNECGRQYWAKLYKAGGE